MKNKKLIISILLPALAVLYVASPYLALKSLHSAVEDGDRDKLENRIDFPTVRNNLKDDVNAMMASAMAEVSEEDADDSGMEAFAMIFASTIVDGMIDGFVTPSGISKLIKEGQLEEEDKETTVSEENEEMPELTYAFFQSPTKFKATLGNDLTLILKLDGLSWKLVRLIIPEDEE
jgi:uncharacterized membrane protein YvbJ